MEHFFQNPKDSRMHHSMPTDMFNDIFLIFYLKTMKYILPQADFDSSPNVGVGCYDTTESGQLTKTL